MFIRVDDFKINFKFCYSSGGITRNWIGVPRMLYESPGSKQYRCICIRLDSKEFEEYKAIIQAYDGCDNDSIDCVVGNTS